MDGPLQYYSKFQVSWVCDKYHLCILYVEPVNSFLADVHIIFPPKNRNVGQKWVKVKYWSIKKNISTAKHTGSS